MTTRKEFLKTIGVLTGNAVLLPVLGNFAGCSASAETTKVKVSGDGIIKYNVSGKLKNPGDGELIEIENTASKIILIKEKVSTFAAFNPVCTHKGCELVKRKDFFECPCHGSEFDFIGNVLKGPATEPLQKLKTEFDGKNTVTIYLR
jgi:Rieske Fe-S protein